MPSRLQRLAQSRVDPVAGNRFIVASKSLEPTTDCVVSNDGLVPDFGCPAPMDGAGKKPLFMETCMSSPPLNLASCAAFLKRFLTPLRAVQNLPRRAFIAGAALAIAAASLPLGSIALADELGADRPWMGTWAASPHPGSTSATARFPAQTTLRQIVRTSIAGNQVRVRFSNEMGTESLRIGSAHIAQRATGAEIVPGTDRALTFGGRPSITVPPGAPVLSDPVHLDVPALADLAVSLYLPDETAPLSFHGTALQTNYVAPAGGDYTGAVALPAGTTRQAWYFLTAVNVQASPRAAAIVTLGDSITDGVGSTADANRRWPNVLAQRLQARRNNDELAVLNEGINANRIFTESGVQPAALKRFDRDVLAQAGVQYLIVLLGTNDIGHTGLGDAPPVTVADMIAGYRQIIDRAHEHRITVYGATLTPFGTSRYDVGPNEALRQAVNQWIRNSGEFDGVIDFDRATRDPRNPRQYLPLYDSGDHLHPSDAGYQAMGEAIPLRLFQETAAANSR
jgi:lysophospholipase L1-like esterase